MASLLTNELAQFLKSRDWPLKLQYGLMENEERTCVVMVLFRDNLNALSGEDKLQTANTINETFNRVVKTGIPIRTQVEKGTKAQWLTTLDW